MLYDTTLMDWEMLAAQKLTLVQTIEELRIARDGETSPQIEDLTGILNLLDDIQDRAIEAGVADEVATGEDEPAIEYTGESFQITPSPQVLAYVREAMERCDVCGGIYGNHDEQCPHWGSTTYIVQSRTGERSPLLWDDEPKDLKPLNVRPMERALLYFPTGRYVAISPPDADGFTYEDAQVLLGTESIYVTENDWGALATQMDVPDQWNHDNHAATDRADTLGFEDRDPIIIGAALLIPAESWSARNLSEVSDAEAE